MHERILERRHFSLKQFLNELEDAHIAKMDLVCESSVYRAIPNNDIRESILKITTNARKTVDDIK